VTIVKPWTSVIAPVAQGEGGGRHGGTRQREHRPDPSETQGRARVANEDPFLAQRGEFRSADLEDLEGSDEEVKGSGEADDPPRG
jgi:hypothetical protein